MSERLYAKATAAIERTSRQDYKDRQKAQLINERIQPFYELAANNRTCVKRALKITEQYNGSVRSILSPVIAVTPPHQESGVSIGTFIQPTEGEMHIGGVRRHCAARLAWYAIAGHQLDKVRRDPFFGGSDLIPIDSVSLYGIADEFEPDLEDELIYKANGLISGPFARSLRHSLAEDTAKNTDIAGQRLDEVEFALSGQSNLNPVLTERYGALEIPDL